MKSKLVWTCGLLTAVLVCGSYASAATIVTFNQNGSGSIDFGSGPTALTGSLQQDPGPGGQPSVLTYVMNSPSLTAGDLLLSGYGKLLDDIRFNPSGTGGNPNYLPSVVFYSSNAGSLAGTSQQPLGTYTNSLTIPQVAGAQGTTGASYTPTSGQPGYVSGFAVTYQITTGNVPEPASILLMLCGGIALLVVSRVKRLLA